MSGFGGDGWGWVFKTLSRGNKGVGNNKTLALCSRKFQREGYIK